ncbi:MAG: O-antigen ligase family protein [Patescibacteria group bacterium]|jgi:O-antigen ligase/Flp pilus assembly protein TadD
MLDRERLSYILLKFIKIGVFFILFLPIVMQNTFFFPFIVPKNIFFRIATEVIFAAYLILAHLKPEFRPSFNKIVWSVLLFFGVSTLATFAGIGIYSSFWGNYERMSGLFHLGHLVMYFLVLVGVFKEKKDWHSFLTFSVVVSSFMCILGLAQWLGVPFLLRSSGGVRLTGTVGNPTFFAAYLIFNLFFILYFIAKPGRFNLKVFSYSFFFFDGYLIISSLLYKIFPTFDWQGLNFLKAPVLIEAFKYPSFFYAFLFLQILILAVWFFRSKKCITVLLAIIFLFEFIIFFNTQTRGAVVGFVAGIAFLAFATLFLKKIDKKIRLFSLILLLLILVSPLALFFAKDTPFVQNIGTLKRLANISMTNITTQSRLLTWQASWKGWTESPKSFLVGFGPENYYYAFNKNFPVPIYKDAGSQIWFDRAHNIIFDVGVTTGIIGLIVYLSILFFASWSLFKDYQKSKVFSSSFLLIALIIAYFIQNFFVFDTLNTEIPFYLLLAFVVYLSSIRNQESEKPAEGQVKDPNYIYLVIIIIALLFGVLGINIRTLRANGYLYQGLVSKAITGQFSDAAFELIKKSINEAVVGKFEARQQLADYVNNFAKSKDASLAKAQTMINYASDELNKSVKEEPLNVRHYLYLATFYNATTKFNTTNPQKVLELMETGTKLSPTRPQAYYEAGQAYLYLGKFDLADEYFKKGLKLAPLVLEDNLSLLSIYIVSKNYESADNQFKLMLDELKWQPTVADYQRLVELYGRNNFYPKMIEFQNKVVELQPTAAEYARLAAIYAKIGENQKAKEATQKAVELDPAFSKEAEQFLQLLEAGELLEQTK